MKKKFTLSGVFMLLFILLIVMLKTYDVAKIGPCETSIGFAALNGAIHDFFGINNAIYKITDILGYISLLTIGIFAYIGFIQLIKRKSIAKIDKEILALGILYAVTIFIYLLFENVIINYRPVLMPDSRLPKASFPSSHTMLSCIIMSSTVMVLKNYVASIKLQKALKFICIIILAATVLGRLACGVHWFTDILGGILISASLLFAFSGFLDKRS